MSPKTIHNISSLAVCIVGALTAFDWGGFGLSPQTGGMITLILGVVKTGLNNFMGE